MSISFTTMRQLPRCFGFYSFTPCIAPDGPDNSRLGRRVATGVDAWQHDRRTLDRKWPDQRVLRLHWLATHWSVEHIKKNLDQLIHPSAAKAQFDHQLEEVRAIQGDAINATERSARHSIDFFGMQHGIVPLNNLNYHPRPMGGGPFNAYNAYTHGTQPRVHPRPRPPS